MEEKPRGTWVDKEKHTSLKQALESAVPSFNTTVRPAPAATAAPPPLSKKQRKRQWQLAKAQQGGKKSKQHGLFDDSPCEDDATASCHADQYIID